MDYQAYYDIEQFPKLLELCESWEIIKDELFKLRAPQMNIERGNKNYEEIFKEVLDAVQKGSEYGWILGYGEENPNSRWTQYGLVINDYRIPFARIAMKKTMELLDNISGINICALITMFPKTGLHCHTHLELREKNLLQLHLPLKTAEDKNYAYLNVEGQFAQHVMGQPIVFDGALDHFAINESPEPRTILYMEFSKKLMK